MNQQIADLHNAAQRLEACGAWYMASIYRGFIDQYVKEMGLK